MKNHPFNIIAALVEDEVTHISLLKPGRTVKEELINFFRNSILPNSTLLRNFIDFDGTKYMLLTNEKLIYIKVKGIDYYKISNRKDYTINEIKNLNHQRKRNQDTIIFDYHNNLEKFVFFSATILPGGIYYDDPDTINQTIMMQKKMLEKLKMHVKNNNPIL